MITKQEPSDFTVAKIITNWRVSLSFFSNLFLCQNAFFSLRTTFYVVGRL